jgi:quercetin dioxygenase-like cupin family protein
MARTGDEIVNPRTGQRMVFLETGRETGGRSLRIDTFNPPTGVPEPEHVHPFQESGAQVLSGSLRFRVDGEERSVAAGDSITIPANTPHNFWNDGEAVAHAVQWFRPALKTDRFFESFFGLAQDGKLNAEGLPPLFQLAVMVPHFGDEIRLTKPPWILQRALLGALTPVGRMLGYRPDYPYGARDGLTGREVRRSPTRPAIAGFAVVLGVFALLLTLFLLRKRGLSRKS